MLNNIENVLKECKSGNYIFRGENQYYPKVSSSLYRQYENLEAVNNILEIEQKIVRRAKHHIRPGAANLEVLTDLQHYGGTTALIDFTKNIFVALFFACDGSPNEDGRVIQMNIDSIPNRDEIAYPDHEDIVMAQPTGKSPRVIFQSSVFVHPAKGFVDKNKYACIKIGSSDKNSILSYLKEKFNISHETIYNDIHGFIRNQGPYSPINSKTLSTESGKISGGKDMPLTENKKKNKSQELISLIKDAIANKKVSNNKAQKIINMLKDINKDKKGT